MQTFRTLYKRDVSGGIRRWHQEIEGDSWRTVSGVMGGQLVASEWHKCEAKNVGRANATTAAEQAIREVESNYTKRLELGYFEDINAIDGDIYFKPMLAQDYEDHKTKLNFGKNKIYSQPKLDGVRCLVTSRGLFSRKGKPIVAAPHIWEAYARIGVWNRDETVVFDGELYNHDLREDFNEIVSIVRKSKVGPAELKKSADIIQHWVYDVYIEVDFDLRLAFLNANICNAGGPSVIFKVPTLLSISQEQLDEDNGRYMAAGYEGQMVRLNGPYEQKRSKLLLKRKEFKDEEFRLVAIEEGVGNRSGMAGRAVCRLADGRTFGAGIKGSHDYARKLLQDFREGKFNLDRAEVTVRFFQYTPDNVPRFPVAVALYENGRDI